MQSLGGQQGLRTSHSALGGSDENRKKEREERGSDRSSYGTTQSHRGKSAALNNWHVMKVTRAWVAWEIAVPSPRSAPQMQPLVGISGKSTRLPFGSWEGGLPLLPATSGESLSAPSMWHPVPRFQTTGLTIRPASRTGQTPPSVCPPPSPGEQKRPPLGSRPLLPGSPGLGGQRPEGSRPGSAETLLPAAAKKHTCEVRGDTRTTKILARSKILLCGSAIPGKKPMAKLPELRGDSSKSSLSSWLLISMKKQQLG